MIKLFHHPYSRASGVVWALEEIGQPYELVYTDIMKGEHKAGTNAASNPMGKLPTLIDTDGTVVTESAAIDLYLADRYAYGTLAPKHDDPRRAAYFRWSFFAPSVIEPASMSKLQKWEYRASNAGWGTFEDMLASVDSAIATNAFVCGAEFTMADVIFGGTLRFMSMFKMIEPSPAVAAYLDRIAARPALQRADAKNAAIVTERGLGG